MNEPSPFRNERLDDLFELELQFDWQMPPVTSREAGEGEYIGSGKGTARGARVNGTIRWDLFEKREETLCRSNLTGVIETHDGSQIQFDSRGFFIQPDQAKPEKWITSASVHFFTADGRYEWLNPRLAVWEGEFDMATFRHLYQVRLRVAE